MPKQEDPEMFASSTSAPSAKFGTFLDTPKGRMGYCATSDVPALVAECGCADDRGVPLKVSSLPFQGLARINGSTWILRVEPLGSFDVNGTFQNAHLWDFHVTAGPADTDR